jgi:multiple sugar transport system substrate-binding protein
MHNRGELTEDMENQFEADHPGITMDFLVVDQTRFFAMYAAGDPPDILRVQAPFVPQALARNMLFDMTPYFEASQVLRMDDLAPANNYYKANSPLEVGAGPIYGMAKDFSPDFTLYSYQTAFDNVGLTVPDDTTPLTYAEVHDLVAQMNLIEGDRTLIFGYAYELYWTDRIWDNMAMELDKTIYADNYNRINLGGDEDVKAIVKWYYDVSSENLCANPLNPSGSWVGEDFDKGNVALIQYGYWFGAMAETDVTRGLVKMLPAPTWAGVRRDTTMTATGAVMAKATDVADAAWVIFEWFNGGQPALDRASSGWGVPALKSLYSLMPSETPYQQQLLTVLQGELAVMDTIAPIQFNPFLGETTVAESYLTNLDRALRDEFDFDGMVAAIESEINTAIQEGVDRIL